MNQRIAKLTALARHVLEHPRLPLALALVPAATAVPLSKNLGFVAMGAFGVIACFLAHLAARQERAAMPGPVRAMAWCVAGGLVLAHIPGALVGRVALALASPFVPELWKCFSDLEEPPEIGGRDVVALNDPSMIVLPFDRISRGKPLPHSARVLVPGITPSQVKRAGASTLILKAKGTDLFESPDLGPMHVGYAVSACNDLLMGGRTWKTGDWVTRKRFVAEVLEVSRKGAPRAVAFHFDKPLESWELENALGRRRHLSSRFPSAPSDGQNAVSAFSSKRSGFVAAPSNGKRS